ncbi:MAG: DMT family transporter [Bacteroidia bacterium]|nr:DMT family transporter [Bacteroidia bacterium]
MLKQRIIYHILAFVTVAIWGVTFVCTKVLIAAGLDPAQIFAMRFIIAYLGLWVICLIRKGQASKLFGSLKDELLFLALGISGGSFYFLTENHALANTQACNVSFLVCSAPLWTLLLSLILKRAGKTEGQENVRLTPKIIIGTLLALAGMAMTIFGRESVNFSPKGDLLALAAALCWAVYSILMGPASARYGSIFITRKVFFYGLLTIIPFLLTQDPPPLAVLAAPRVLFNLLFLALFASLLCFVLWNKVIAGLGNFTATNYVYLNPFFTLLFAMLLLGETLSPIELTGCVTIVAGVYLAAEN